MQKVIRGKNVKILAIVNPAAGKTCKRWPTIKRVFKEMEYDIEVQFTEERDHATSIAAEANGVDVIASVGGDGTLNEIINGVVGKDVVISVIPVGTGNDFVKSADLYTDYVAAARSISVTNVRHIDVGLVTFGDKKRYFIGVAGMGFDGLVSKTTSKINKPQMGTVSYLMMILKHLSEYTSMKVSLTVDDICVDQEVMFVDVANGKYVGAGMTIAPLAEVDDGLFDVIVIGNFGKIESLIRLPTLYKGTHLTNSKVGFFRGRHVELRSDEPLSIHVEGEYIGQTPATFDIIDKALRISAPVTPDGRAEKYPE